MTHPLALALAVALTAIATPALAQSAKADAAVPAQAQPQAGNPFFTKSTLPLQYPHFDKIKDSDFAPAFDRGMAEQLKEIDAIANQKAKPTFDNTIVADGEVRPAAQPHRVGVLQPDRRRHQRRRARSSRPTTRRSCPRTATRSR